jgi:alkanesulfonate monooxygenase SsuD/methylene tetrahydromethanopterin reductase-like flavin-dependent oxidoreductase (luciferase family)
MKIGYFLSCEEWGPHDLVSQAVKAVKHHRGLHYRVDHARVYDLPDEPPPIIVSGFGRKSVELAARIGDGYCTVGPDSQSVDLFRSAGGGEKLVQGGLKVCWGADEAQAVQTVHRLWPNEGLPGELARRWPCSSRRRSTCC